MNKIFAIIAALGQVYFLFPLSAGAAVPEGLSGAGTALNTATGEEGGDTALTTLIGNFISVLLGILGIIFLVLVLYSGFLYLTDQGSGEKVKTAKKILTTSIIGLILIVAAYAISSYVISALTTIAG